MDHQQAIKIAADSIEQLRKCDVDRVLDSMPDQASLDSMRDFISSYRLDLAGEATERTFDIYQERNYPNWSASATRRGAWEF